MFTVIIAVYFVIVFILSLPFLGLTTLIRKKDIRKAEKISARVLKVLAKGCLFLSGTRVKVSGMENIPDEPALFVGNHRSYYDIIGFYGIINRPVGFVSKESLKKVPMLSKWMENIGCLFLNRENVREGLKTILEGIDYIKNGGSLFIFPEGTRAKGEEMGEFKQGSLKLADKSGCPIVPVAIIGTDNVLEKNKFGVMPAKCKFIFGEPIYIDKLELEQKKHSAEYVREKIAELIEKNK